MFLLGKSEANFGVELTGIINVETVAVAHTLMRSGAFNRVVMAPAAFVPRCACP